MSLIMKQIFYIHSTGRGITRSVGLYGFDTPPYKDGLSGIRRIRRAVNQYGKRPTNPHKAYICHGNTMRPLLAASPLAMRTAESSGDIKNGIGNGFLSVSGVLINPGHTTFTRKIDDGYSTGGDVQAEYGVSGCRIGTAYAEQSGENCFMFFKID